jgi:hypothetical protein
MTGSNAFTTDLGNQGHFIAGGAAIDLNAVLPNAPDGFTVAFDFDRRTDPAGGGNGYIGFGIGTISLAPADIGGAYSISRSEFGVRFPQAANRNAANMEAFENLGTASLGAADYFVRWCRLHSTEKKTFQQLMQDRPFRTSP